MRTRLANIDPGQIVAFICIIAVVAMAVLLIKFALHAFSLPWGMAALILIIAIIVWLILADG